MRDPSNREHTVEGTPFDGFLANLAQAGAQLRRAKQLKPRNLPPEQPIPGSLDAQREALRWAHELPGVPDLRSDPRRSVDQVWRRLAEECQRRFGRAPSVDPADHGDPGVVAALRRAREAEATYLSFTAASHATGDSIKTAMGRFTAAVAKFANAATAGWPTANERARAARREADWR